MNPANAKSYRGVDYHKHTRRYRARVRLCDVEVFQRYYKTAEEAARARDEQILYWRINAPLNFPETQS